MSYNKEKLKIESLLQAIQQVPDDGAESFERLNELFLEFSKVISVLYKKQPNVFGNIYKYDHREIKAYKRQLRESIEISSPTHVGKFKNHIEDTAERTLEYITIFLS